MSNGQESRTSSEIFQKGFLQPFLHSEERPFVKLLNWYTGFGKTYTAAVFAIDLFLNRDVIPVFIAPLQSLVAGFASDIQGHHRLDVYGDEIEAAIRSTENAVPVYRLYSIDYHLNDRTFYAAALALVNWIHGSPQVVRDLEILTGQSARKDDLMARLAELRAKSVICQQSPYLGMSTSDDTYEDTQAAYLRAARRARSVADSLTADLIRMELAARERKEGSPGYLDEPAVADMVRRLHPLQAFLDRPGIIISTASKAQVSHGVFVYDKARQRSKPENFENLPAFLEELNREGSELGRKVSRRADAARVVTFVDEEEDSYWYLFSQRKSLLNPDGRSDLSIVVSEFFTYFDLKWPFAFERSNGNHVLAGKVYDSLEQIADVAEAVHREFELERERTKARFISDKRRTEIFARELATKSEQTAARFDNAELLEILKQLVDKNDVQSGFRRFRQKARVLAKLREYIWKIRGSGRTAYQTFKDVTDLVCDKKFFTMTRSTYGEVLDQPAQTFFTETASVMDTDFLRRVELVKDTGHQTIRLHYHEVESPEYAYTLLDYLGLVIFMARVLAPRSGEAVVEFSSQDIERYPKLHRFRTDVGALFKGAISEDGVAEEASSEEAVTDEFVFSEIKSVVTLGESWHQAEEYNLESDVSLTISISTLRATPEEDVRRALGRSNGMYLMSATGGLEDSSAGAFNIRQIKRVLEEKGGVLFEMTAPEISVVSTEAEALMQTRDRTVTILSDSDPSPKFGVSKGYAGLVQQIKAAVPDAEDGAYAFLNRHKHNEIEGLVASLDRLLSTSIRSGIVLCQTVSHMRNCLMKLARTEGGWVSQRDDSGYHFVVRSRKLPTYRNSGADNEDITIILYKAERFRKRDASKIGALEEQDEEVGQFNEELESALDISTKKVLLWSAYASASRGINFVTKLDGEERDFELFCLLNDPYYTKHTRPSRRGFSMEMFQSFVQVLRDDGQGWSLMSRGDLLYQYARHRWDGLRKEHVIDITRTVFQALGRGERRPRQAMPTQHIFLSSEAARTVHLGLGYVKELRRRASPAQREVLGALDRYNVETRLFESDEHRQKHAVESLKKALAFRGFTSELPKRFRSDEGARVTWASLFDEAMFKNPAEYLRSLDSRGVPAAYREGCFEQAPAVAQPYSREFSVAGKRDVIVTDAFDGSDIYDWIGRVVPDGLLTYMSNKSRALLRQAAGYVTEEEAGKTKWIPQPWFVAEVMKGYLAELEFEEYMREQFNLDLQSEASSPGRLAYLDPMTHSRCDEIYQVFDYYLVAPNNLLIAVDMKNWARSTDRLNRVELQEIAEEKHARLSAIFSSMTVHAIYVNLYGAHKHSVVHPKNGTIRFMSLYLQNTHGARSWIRNQNLASALWGH